MLTESPYTILADHTKNLAMLCRSITHLLKRDLCDEQMMTEFSQRVELHVKEILNTAAALPEEAVFTEFCLQVTPFGEEKEFFQNHSTNIIEFYNHKMRDIWKKHDISA